MKSLKVHNLDDLRVGGLVLVSKDRAIEDAEDGYALMVMDESHAPQRACHVVAEFMPAHAPESPPGVIRHHEGDSLFWLVSAQ